MTRIGGGGPKVPDQANLQTQQGLKTFKEAAGKEVPQKVVDSFARAGTQIQAKLAGLNGTQLAQRLNFTNEDLALLARSFASVLNRKPNANRKERSRMFAKAILKKRGKKGKLSRLLDDENEDHDENDRRALEDLYDMIAQQLESTPVFAQLVDEVTESVRKIR